MSINAKGRQLVRAFAGNSTVNLWSNVSEDKTSYRSLSIGQRIAGKTFKNVSILGSDAELLISALESGEDTTVGERATVSFKPEGVVVSNATMDGVEFDVLIQPSDLKKVIGHLAHMVKDFELANDYVIL